MKNVVVVIRAVKLEISINKNSVSCLGIVFMSVYREKDKKQKVNFTRLCDENETGISDCL